MQLKEKLEELKFLNTGNVRPVSGETINLYRKDILKLIEALELTINQRDFFIRCSRDLDIDREKDINHDNEQILKIVNKESWRS